MTVSIERDNAVVELHRYLSGLTQPLRAAELFEALVVIPPEHVASEIQSWVRAQRQASPATATSEFLFHALRKLYLFGELGVVDALRAETFFDWLLPLVLESAPHDERPRLRARIASMTHRVAVVPTFTGNVPIPATPPPPVETETSPPAASEHFELILARVAREKEAGVNLADDEALATVAELVTLAATTAASRDDLRDLIRRIPTLVPPAQLGNVFQLLGRSIPPWEIVLPDEERSASIPTAIDAMRRIVSLSADELELAKRWRELVNAGVERFNSGSLYAASLMLELARRLVEESALDKAVVDRITSEAARALESTKLRDFVGERGRHALLRNVLAAFPSLSTDALLADLRGEKRPERRRSLLALLEAWGPAARDAALKRLQEELEHGPGGDTWFLRNTIFLLHRIPRASDNTIDAELEILRRASSREQAIWVVKEAVVAIGTIRGQVASRLLIERLNEQEGALLRGDDSQGPLVERVKAVDRIVTALAKVGTPEALRRIVSHALRVEPALGDSRARLAAVTQVDLSSSPEAVQLLLGAIRSELPTGLGRVMGKAANTTPLIQALASTDTPVVRELLEEIASKHERAGLGPVAAATLAQVATSGQRLASADIKPLTGIKESGELRAFGLPELVQSLGESNASGALTIADAARKPRGRLVFARGRVLEAESSALRDDEAFFNLVEHPDAGWYTFTTSPLTDGNLLAEIAPLLAEGLRRHDQLMRARVLVPDRSTFKHKGPRPTPHSEEKDPALMKEVWRRTVSGRTVGSWESDLGADAFRLRRLVVHWLTEGAIEDTRA